MAQGDLPKPSTYGTARYFLAEGYIISAYCRRCDRWADLDLARMVRDGDGDRQLIPLRLRCSVCGSVGEGQVQPPCPGSPGYEPTNKPGGGV